MKKYFNVFFTCLLFVFSFYYTKKLTDFTKENDSIMKEIISSYTFYEIDSIDGVLIEDNYTLGCNGVSVDIDKSYLKMKSYNKYNSDLFVFNNVLPNVSLDSNYDKYIVRGNSLYNNISFIIDVNSIDVINSIIKFLDGKNANVSFLVNNELIFNNYFEILGSIKESSIQCKSVDKVCNALVQDINRNDFLGCIFLDKDEQLKDKCILNEMYLIKPSIVIDKSLTSLKSNISSGDIIYMKVNSSNLDYFINAINYVIQKGYSVIPLNDLISEYRD